MTEYDSLNNPPPRDGSVINVRFGDGTLAKARWNQGDECWKVLSKNRRWISMKYNHGHDNFKSWWCD